MLDVFLVQGIGDMNQTIGALDDGGVAELARGGILQHKCRFPGGAIFRQGNGQFVALIRTMVALGQGVVYQ